MRLIFDIESDGLIPELTKIHCIVIVNADTGDLKSYADQLGHTPVSEALDLLAKADELIGHNIINFDIPAIQKLHPKWKPSGRVTDTIILTKLLFGDIKERDLSNRNSELNAGRKPTLPGQMIGRHSLESWGYRLGKMKGDYTDWCKENGIDTPWADWRPEMHTYCEQDGRVTQALYEMLARKFDLTGEWARAIDVETRFANLIQKQEAHGFRFNTALAEKLEAELRIKIAEANDQMNTLFAPWWVRVGEYKPTEKTNLRTWVTDDEHGGLTRTVKDDTGETYVHRFASGKTQTRKVKREIVRRGYYQTVSPEGYHRVELRVFNPGSRQHVADRLQKLYGWKPAEFTDSGEVKVDDDILQALPYPPAKSLAAYYMLEKRLGQIADGKQAWLKQVKNDRIHGRVNTLGAITHRCTHSDPNVAQTPSIENANGKVPYGAEFRSCWTADPGHVLVGCDADGLELRCLAHFMKDGGRYARIVDEGIKDNGTDIHTMNMKAAQLNSRANAKTFIYAFLYGAGDEKIGSIVGGGSSEGKKLKNQFLKGTPGLSGLIEAVKGAAKSRGYIRGIDGRRVTVRHQHAALNTLLQSTGAVAMKYAAVAMYEELTGESLGYGLPPLRVRTSNAKPLRWGSDWAMVANIHDEYQLTTKPEHAPRVAEVASWAIEEAGSLLAFKCPLRGSSSKPGANWKDTH